MIKSYTEVLEDKLELSYAEHIAAQLVYKTNDRLASSIRKLHFDATGQYATEEEIIEYFRSKL